MFDFDNDCEGLLTDGILRDCSTVNAAIGVDKDLILVNYEDLNREQTFANANLETDDTNSNECGLSEIILNAGTVQHIFEGTDYSVIPTITTEVRGDGDSWFVHSIAFIVYSKLAKDRKTLIDLGQSTVVAIVRDRSTGLYELLGADQGLKVSALDRTYVGDENSNYYSVTIATPDVAVVREGNIGWLANSIRTL